MSPEFIVLTILAFLFPIAILTLGKKRKKEKIRKLDSKVLEIIKDLISGSPDLSIHKGVIYTSCKKLLGIEAQEAYDSVERLKKANYVKEPQVWYPGYAMVSTGYIVLCPGA